MKKWTLLDLKLGKMRGQNNLITMKKGGGPTGSKPRRQLVLNVSKWSNEIFKKTLHQFYVQLSLELNVIETNQSFSAAYGGQ